MQSFLVFHTFYTLIPGTRDRVEVPCVVRCYWWDGSLRVIKANTTARVWPLFGPLLFLRGQPFDVPEDQLEDLEASARRQEQPEFKEAA